jgi:hypothetical protein
MTDSTHLNLPYIMPGQAQKHITHNEAIAALDILTQLAVLDRDLNDPPAIPDVNMRYIVGSAPTGDWTGKSGSIASWSGAAWEFRAPRPGWLAFVLDENGLVAWNGTAWQPTFGLDNMAEFLGLHTTADTTNRLAVASDAILFTHASAGVQVKVNKHSSGDTASFIFQTGYSGRAEFGTTGDDRFHLKVSPDGSTWSEALVIDPTTLAVQSGGPIGLRSCTVATLPAATPAGQMIYVSNESGGAVPAFSDGAAWRRVTDRAVVT